MLKQQFHKISPTSPRLPRGLPALVACFLLTAHVTADESKTKPADRAAFGEAREKAVVVGLIGDSAVAPGALQSLSAPRVTN